VSEIKRPVRVVDLGPCFGIEDAEGTEIARTAVVHTSVRPDWAMTDRAWAEEIVAALNAQPVAADLIAALQQNDELRRETVVGRPSSGKTAALNALAEATAPDAGDVAFAAWARNVHPGIAEHLHFVALNEDAQYGQVVKERDEAAAREAVYRGALERIAEEADKHMSLAWDVVHNNANAALATPSPAAERMLAVVQDARTLADIYEEGEVTDLDIAPLVEHVRALDGGASDA